MPKEMSLLPHGLFRENLIDFAVKRGGYEHFVFKRRSFTDRPQQSSSLSGNVHIQKEKNDFSPYGEKRIISASEELIQDGERIKFDKNWLSKREETDEVMEIETLPSNLKEPEDSGAYIRSLVRQLTSSPRPKSSMTSKGRSRDGDGDQNTTQFGKNSKMNQQTQQPHPHKKQVRRRLHTSRPYQERLLDMAEARREIANALKLHRAAMRQANEQKEREQHQHQDQHHPLLMSGWSSSLPNSNCGRSFSSYIQNLSHGSLSYSSPSSPPNGYPLQLPTSTFSPAMADNFNFPLPEQPLGLNLNLHDVSRSLDTSFFLKHSNSSSVCYSSSPSSSSSPPVSCSTHTLSSLSDNLDKSHPPHVKFSDGMESSSNCLHQAVDDDEIAAMRSLADHHQMEWNDTLNLLSSACWSKISNSMDTDTEEVKSKDVSGSHPFDELMDPPSSWFDTTDLCLQQQQHLTGPSSRASYHDYDLPRMDIGDIDGVVGEWLS